MQLVKLFSCLLPQLVALPNGNISTQVRAFGVFQAMDFAYNAVKMAIANRTAIYFM